MLCKRYVSMQFTIFTNHSKTYKFRRQIETPTVASIGVQRNSRILWEYIHTYILEAGIFTSRYRSLGWPAGRRTYQPYLSYVEQYSTKSDRSQCIGMSHKLLGRSQRGPLWNRSGLHIGQRDRKRRYALGLWKLHTKGCEDEADETTPFG